MNRRFRDLTSFDDEQCALTACNGFVRLVVLYVFGVCYFQATFYLSWLIQNYVAMS